MKIIPIIAVLLCIGTVAVYPQQVADTVDVQKSVTARVSGTVLDAGGEPLIGASVVLSDNPDNAVVTDADGHFVVSGVVLPCKLKISYTGYVDRVVKVNSKNVDNLTIKLTPVYSNLDEVVVVGYATRKKLTLPAPYLQ